MKRVKRYSSTLEAITKLPPKAIPHIIPHLDKDILKAVGEVVVNTLDGNIPLDKKQRKQLKPYKQGLRSIADCCRHKKYKSRDIKTLVSRQRGGFLPALLVPALSLIAKSILGGAVASTAGLAIKKLANG